MITKDIKDFEGIYAVREDGEIVSMKTGVDFVLKGGSCHGYRSYSLRKNNKQYQFLGHRLVALAFIDNPKCKKQVNHKDGNKKNNAISNLEWVTNSENLKHAVLTGLITITDQHLNLMREKSGKNLAFFTKTESENIKTIYRFMAKPSSRKLAKAYGCSKTTIQKIVNGSHQFYKA